MAYKWSTGDGKVVMNMVDKLFESMQKISPSFDPATIRSSLQMTAEKSFGLLRIMQEISVSSSYFG